jgi:predicted alpha/beta hydrolase family esterase
VREESEPAKLLIVPGLHNSGPLHWQSWLQSLHRGAVRVEQDDWEIPDLDGWAARIAGALESCGPGPCLAVAHSFGCLALIRCLAKYAGRPAQAVKAALLVAPADPDKFSVGTLLPHRHLGIPTTLVASATDPWIRLETAQAWALRWGSAWVNLGNAGHVNSASGHGPLPLAQEWVLGFAGGRLKNPAPRSITTV